MHLPSPVHIHQHWLRSSATWKKILEIIVGGSFNKCYIIKLELLKAQGKIQVGKIRTLMARIKT